MEPLPPYAEIFDQLHDGVIIADAEGVIIGCTTGAERHSKFRVRITPAGQGA